jgi:ADP-heptose:LPS heptosyltransferase
LKKARLYVGNDSGLMHLAAALGTPTLGLFGPGFPYIYGPWGKNCAFAVTPETREELLARYHHGGMRETSLMGSLTVDNALMAAKELLGRTGQESTS